MERYEQPDERLFELAFAPQVNPLPFHLGRVGIDEDFIEGRRQIRLFDHVGHRRRSPAMARHSQSLRHAFRRDDGLGRRKNFVEWAECPLRRYVHEHQTRVETFVDRLPIGEHAPAEANQYDDGAEKQPDSAMDLHKNPSDNFSPGERSHS